MRAKVCWITLRFSFPQPASVGLPGGFRVHAVAGDGMEPILRGNRDYVLTMPVDSYRGEGLYLIDTGVGVDLFRVTAALEHGLLLTRENPRYQDHVIDLEIFEECVIGIVVADIRPRDERLLSEA